jgi:hypothetical protein
MDKREVIEKIKRYAENGHPFRLLGKRERQRVQRYRCGSCGGSIKGQFIWNHEQNCFN